MSIFKNLWVAILASSIRLAIPYVVAGLGGTYSERSGVVNIGLKGMMLTGAFSAVAVTNATGSPQVVPSQFIDMIPYVLTILVLASAIGRATPPASIGVPYIKEQQKQSQIAFNDFGDILVADVKGGGLVLFHILGQAAAVFVAGALFDILCQKRVAGQIFMVK